MRKTVDDPVLVGQIRRAPSGRHYVVMWIEGRRVLVGRNSNPENDHSWDDIDKINEWTLLRSRMPVGTSRLGAGGR